jgi:hypothetical protein
VAKAFPAEVDAGSALETRLNKDSSRPFAPIRQREAFPIHSGRLQNAKKAGILSRGLWERRRFSPQTLSKEFLQ